MSPHCVFVIQIIRYYNGEEPLQGFLLFVYLLQ